MNPEQIEFNKFLGKIQKEASIKACLRAGDDKLKCSGKVIHAHSIQRGKILESIADECGENEGKIYQLGFTPAEDMQSMQPEFKLQGIKNSVSSQDSAATTTKPYSNRLRMWRSAQRPSN